MRPEAGDARLCADGVQRGCLGQWQGYVQSAWEDDLLADQRLGEVPETLRPQVAAHLRSRRVLGWVHRVLGSADLDDRRGMLAQCPADLREDVADQVAVLWRLRSTRVGRIGR